MKCKNCQHNFKANWQVDCYPGGQEAPGTFAVVGVLFFVPAIAFFVFSYWLIGFALLGISGFVWLQMLVAWIDCRGVYCPECEKKLTLWPWSR